MILRFPQRQGGQITLGRFLKTYLWLLWSVVGTVNQDFLSQKSNKEFPPVLPHPVVDEALGRPPPDRAAPLLTDPPDDDSA